MKYAIIGSRGWHSEKLVREFVRSLPIDSVIVSGGAAGPDSWGVSEAFQLNMKTIVYKAEWNVYGKAAGMIRNKSIVDECDKLVAFWDGKSSGTKHSIGLAEKQGKLLRIYTMADKSI